MRPNKRAPFSSQSTTTASTASTHPHPRPSRTAGSTAGIDRLRPGAMVGTGTRIKPRYVREYWALAAAAVDEPGDLPLVDAGFRACPQLTQHPGFEHERDGRADDQCPEQRS